MSLIAYDIIYNNKCDVTNQKSIKFANTIKNKNKVYNKSRIIYIYYI